MRPAVVAALSSIAVIAVISYFTLGHKTKTSNTHSITSIKKDPVIKQKTPITSPSVETIADTTMSEKVPEKKTIQKRPFPVVHARPEKNEFAYDPMVSNNIRAKQGTQITIPDHAFVDAENGLPITGPALVTIAEYYSMDDIFFNDLHTMSDSGLLETNGMIHVQVSANNRPCKLAGGKAIDVSFPLVNDKAGMQVFTKDEDDINAVWQAVIVSNRSIIRPPDNADNQNPEGTFPPKLTHGVNALKSYIDNSVRPGYSGWSGTMEIEFVVTEEGYTREIKVLKEINKDATAQIGVAMSNLLWKRGFRNNMPARYRATIAFRYRSGLTGVANLGLVKPFEYAPYIAKEIRTQSFAVPRLGWINCDKFFLFTKKTNLYVADSCEHTVDVKIVFDNYKTIVPACRYQQKYGFEKIPENEPITVIAVKKEAGNYLVSLQHTNSSAGTIGNFEFKTVSKEELKKIILGLDKVSKLNPANTTVMR